MAVSHPIILGLRKVVLAHHARAQQTVKVFLIHASHVRIHYSWIAGPVSVFDLVTPGVDHLLAHAGATLAHDLAQVHVEV